jgi:hypothetical protein
MSLEPAGNNQVTVNRGGEALNVTDRFAVEPGDLIVTGDAGARLQLAGLRSVIIGSNAEVSVAGEADLELFAGSLLVRAVERISVDMGDVDALVRGGRFRIERLPAFEAAATYEGVLTLSEPGEEPVTVRPLFQSAVVAGEALPASPYEFDTDDPWDRLYLDQAIDLDEKLERFSSSLSTQIDSGDLDQFLRAVPDGDVSAVEPYVGTGVRPAPDLFIAAAIALNDPEGSFGTAFERSFALRDEGGEWGIVAGIMGVPSQEVLVSLEKLVNDSEILNSRGRPSPTTGPDDAGESPPSSPRTESCSTLIDCLLDLPAPPGGSGLP